MLTKKKKSYSHLAITLACFLVPRAGLEPARESSLPPQDSVSTNSTTSAREDVLRQTEMLGKLFFKKSFEDLRLGGDTGRFFRS